MISRLKLTADQIRLAVIGGATVLAIGAVGTTAALATSLGHAEPMQADAAPAGPRLLTIQTAAPPPLVMPPAPSAGDRLVVLTDVPADLAYDADLRGSLDTAAIRAMDAAEARRMARETASWEREAASLQAQIAAADHPAYEAVVSQAALSKPVDADITAAAGDTRSATTAQ